MSHTPFSSPAIALADLPLLQPVTAALPEAEEDPDAYWASGDVFSALGYDEEPQTPGIVKKAL